MNISTLLQHRLWELYSTSRLTRKSSTIILLYVMNDSHAICAVHAPYYNEIVVDVDNVMLP
jgi:hypothetical protein